MNIYCDMCGYRGEVDKSEPKYFMLFDLKMKEHIPEQYVNSLGEFQFCSKCRKDLIAFINKKRSDNALLPVMEYEHDTFLQTWISMSNKKKAYVYEHVRDARINGFTSSPSEKANLESTYWKVKDNLTDDDLFLIGYCRDKQDLPESIKRYEKNKENNK